MLFSSLFCFLCLELILVLLFCYSIRVFISQIFWIMNWFCIVFSLTFHDSFCLFFFLIEVVNVFTFKSLHLLFIFYFHIGNLCAFFPVLSYSSFLFYRTLFFSWIHVLLSENAIVPCKFSSAPTTTTFFFFPMLSLSSVVLFILASAFHAKGFLVFGSFVRDLQFVKYRYIVFLGRASKM